MSVWKAPNAGAPQVKAMDAIGSATAGGEAGGGFSWRLPVFASLAGYQASWLRSDLSAGLAIAAVGLPSAIAYPAIAGLPPETGIYASILPLVAYALFGPSRQLIVGPDAATMTVLAASAEARYLSKIR